MTQDIFLQLSGIAGESQDANHRDNIDVFSWEWQVYQAAALHGGNGGGAGKSSVNDLIIEHYTDRASPNLLKYCLTGKPIASATLVIRKAGGNPLEYLKITMHEVMITGVAITSDIHMAQPREEVSLSFARFTLEYVVQNAQGGSAGTVSIGYDIKANREI